MLAISSVDFIDQVSNKISIHTTVSAINTQSVPSKSVKSGCAQIEAKFYEEINDLERKYTGCCHIVAF